MSIPLPTKCRFNSFVLKGIDLTRHLSKLKVYETIFKSYLTANATITDNNNLLESMQLTGGEPCSFVIDAGDGRMYEASMTVLAVKGEKLTQGGRTVMYEINLVGNEYFADKQNLLQQSFKGISGTQAIAKIHQNFFGTPLKILAESLGPISLQSYIVSSKKPMTAISDIMKRLNFAQFNSGNVLYFRDAKEAVLAPMEALFSNMSAQQQFFQENTLGKNWFDIVRAENAIIAAIASVETNKSGRGGMDKIAGAAAQEKKVFDFRTKNVVVDLPARKIAEGIVTGQALGLLAPILNGMMGGHGAQPNYMTMDSSHLPTELDQSNGTEQERLYRAMIGNGPALTVKVPIQSGILCTVGKGADLKLLPAIGDLDNVYPNSMSGMYLITQLCHDCAADDRMVQATTTFECVRGGVG